MKSEIINILTSKAYVKRHELLLSLRVDGIFTNDRQLRATIEDLIMTDGVCIASTDHGYHLIRNQIELMNAVEYLKKKARPIAIRANKLISNYRDAYGEQLNLTFDL